MWLFDTCSVINLSYFAPVGTLIRDRYRHRSGWVQAVHAELLDQRAKRPPHPQAGRAANYASTWLGRPIVLDDPADAEAVEAIRTAIAAGGGDSELDHLGEAASIHALLKHAEIWGPSRLISDDRGARDEARRRGVAAASTVAVIARLLAVTPDPPLTPATADAYLDTLRRNERMRAQLTSAHLLAGDLQSWG